MKKKFLITARRLLFLAFTLALTVSLHAKEPAVSSPETLTYPANCSFVAVPPFAETNLIEITLDHADWTYSLGSNATFKINLAISPYPEAGVPITYRLGPEQFEGAEQSAVVPADGLVISAGTRNEPSFTRIIVKLNRDGKTELPSLFGPFRIEFFAIS